MRPRSLAVLVISLALSAAFFRAGGPRISEPKQARMTSSEPPNPKQGPASMGLGAAGIAGPLFAFLEKVVDHGTEGCSH